MTQSKKTTARKRAKPAKESPIDKGGSPGSEFPTFAELITIAAAISTPDEDEKSTARRAVKLWKACNEVLEEEIRYDEMMKKSNLESRSDFRAACGLSLEDIRRIDTRPADKNSKMVPLDTFLHAVSPNSTPDSIRSKWREFLQFEMAKPMYPEPPWKSRPDQLPSDPEEDLYATRSDQLPSDSEGDIYATALCECHDRFAQFLERSQQAFNRNRAINAARSRQLYSAARAVLNPGEQPTKVQMDLLRGMESEERDLVIKTCCQGPKAEGLLMAAIHDAGLDKNMRPRRIKKNAISEKTLEAS